MNAMQVGKQVRKTRGERDEVRVHEQKYLVYL